jgi:DNA-binding response OmpR family regulator
MKRKIVIVEDDPDILFSLSMMLENEGYEVKALSTARSIIDETDNLPDLYILDKRMPDMDGLDVCRQLRGRNECKHVPIVIISASPKFGPQALKAGASDFLEKPFQMDVFLKLVRKYVTPVKSIL